MENGSVALEAALQKARRDLPLSREDLLSLLGAQGAQRDLLYAAARRQRDACFGGKVFAYGFVYFSTYCHNNCAFCFYRRENPSGIRYRKPRQEVLDTCRELAASGVHLLDLTMGEDPHYVSTPEGRAAILELVAAIKRENGLPVMLSPGVLPAESIRAALKSGVEWYALYQETHNRSLFDKLRLGQSYDARINAKIEAAKSGLLVEEGILAGVGESLGDIADSILAMREMGAGQVRVMSYVPQEGAPLRPGLAEGLYGRELNTIAAMRLAMPNRLIPASLDVAGKAGLKERLDAGANVITSLISPQSGMAGVSNATLDVDNGCRTLPGIADTVAACGLKIASRAEYESAIKTLRTECGYGADYSRWREASGS